MDISGTEERLYSESAYRLDHCFPEGWRLLQRERFNIIIVS